MPPRTADISDAFFAAHRAVALELGCDAVDLLRVEFAESGVRAAAVNHAGSGAVGLIQFMPQTLRGLGWVGGPEAFGRLTAEQQTLFVKRYLLPHKGKLVSLAAIYCAVFMPAFVVHASNPDFVLSQKGGVRGWAWAQNAHYDFDGDERIMVRELGEAVTRNCIGPRWAELYARLTGEALAPPSGKRFDVRTTLGLQSALYALGYACTADGFPGPITTAAVRAFQGAHGLAVDGKPGPKTQAALQAELQRKNLVGANGEGA